MELMNKNKKAMVMKLALLVFLLGFTSTVVDARFDSTSFITQVISNGDSTTNNYDAKSTATACCNTCLCSVTPELTQCRCADVGKTCHSACKNCECGWSSPLCTCYDITDFCYKPCN
ncbi:Bowman birk trypsin inhibitor [Medicago truncatula]|nr:Bowman birk trypsin inhibitor [Medicago truncatula]